MTALVKRSLVDREPEKQALHRLLDDGTAKLALLTGRRRVGKTYLLTHIWDEMPFFLFTAARTTPELNRRQLLTDLAAWSGERIRQEDYPTWRTVFRLLLETKAEDDGPLVVILDEFQYLAQDADGLAGIASELNAEWERQRAARPFLLVLAGSVISMMEALATGGAPLYGRFAYQARLEPFGPWYAGQLAGFPGLRDQALAYGIFGGTPSYLATIRAADTLPENAIRSCLRPTGEVRNQLETALDQEDGLRDVPKYRAILRAVAAGRTQRNAIAQMTGLPNDRGLRDKLERLVDLRYLETRSNVDAKRSDPVRYAVADPAMRFHQRFVEPNRSALERGDATEVWQRLVAPQLDTYMGHEFEHVATHMYDRLRQKLDLPMVERWGKWEGVDRDRKSIEIDLVAPLAAGGWLTGSVKWNRKPVGVRVHHAHLAMLERLARSGRAWAHEALEPGAPLVYVSASGFESGFLGHAEQDGHKVYTLSLEDLYQDLGPE